jgi:hypothetical protein
MTRLTLDPYAPVELCDAQGRTLGYFVPVAEHQRLQRLEEEHQQLLYAWAQARFSDEELERAEAEEEEFTTEEVLKDLEDS